MLQLATRKRKNPARSRRSLISGRSARPSRSPAVAGVNPWFIVRLSCSFGVLTLGEHGVALPPQPVCDDERPLFEFLSHLFRLEQMDKRVSHAVAGFIVLIEESDSPQFHKDPLQSSFTPETVRLASK